MNERIDIMMQTIHDSVTVVIPSYKPDEKLIGTLESIIQEGFTDIVVVDDGGGEQYRPVFDRVREYPQCTVLTHPVNRGKGAALKTAFAYFADNRPNSLGVVTADADGQHLAKDIEAVTLAMAETKAVVLGCRDFTQPHVPTRSKAGNNISAFLYRILLGIKISDTQTGLRAIPREYLDVLAQAEGDRYEYETSVLFAIARECIPLEEVKIQTVYLEENRSSHFRVLHDSLRIYARPIRYMGSTLLSYLIELALFSILLSSFETILPLWSRPLAALGCSKLIGGTVHYLINAFTVFYKKKPSVLSALKYTAWQLAMFCLASGLWLLLTILCPFWTAVPYGLLILKTLLGLVLFFPSFRILHSRIYR